MPEVLVTIEKLIHGGDGLARLPDGQVVFVSGVLPGEEVRVKIVQRLGDYALAHPVEVVSPSPERREPVCPYFPKCGGCQWQHISYEAQVRFKLDIFKETIFRIAEITSGLVEDIAPSPKPLGYRHKLQFHVHQETGTLGFLKRRSHHLVPIRYCFLATPEINQVLKSLPDIPAWKRIHPLVKRVNIGTSFIDRRVTLLFWTKVAPKKDDLAEIIQALPIVKAVFYWTRGPGPLGPYPSEARDGGARFFPVPKEVSGLLEDTVLQAAPGVFVQNNWRINLSLISLVKELASVRIEEEVLDLHCGMGNFLLPLAVNARGGRGIDTDHRAINDALRNAERWGIKNVKFEVISATEALLGCIKQGEVYPIVILDPPRGGCKELVRFLPDVAIDRIIYVSCDPPTLARDLKLLIRQGYIVKKIKVLDMFPQTFHLESATLLVRS